MDSIKKRVIDKFNKELGSDINNLSKCKDIHNNVLTEKCNLEKSLSLASTEAPSKVKKAVENAEQTCAILREKREDAERLRNNVLGRIQYTADVTVKLDEYLEKIKQLQHAMEYLNIVKDIEDISKELENCISHNEDNRAVQLFVSLGRQGIGGRLEGCNAPHLQTFANDTIHFWHNLLKEKFSKDFDDVLTQLKWPFVGNNVSATMSTTTSVEYTQKLQILTEYLLQIQIQVDQENEVHSSVLPDTPTLCLPMILLIKPLRKRFQYHFYGTKQTNRPDKPEWYLTQILSWIRDHEMFVQKNVQPVVTKMGFNHVDARMELTRGLVHLAVEKLHTDLPAMVLLDQHIFTHLIDECLGFDRELRQLLPAQQSLSGVLAVITQAQYFVKWLDMEKKYSTEKMDSMLSSPNAWDPLDPQREDELQVTQVADYFLGLLGSIQERYSSLPQPGHRLQFLELQLELVDDFRLRLIHLLHEQPRDEALSLLPQILNTVNYVATVLTEWGGAIHYLHLYQYKNQLQNIPNGEVDTINEIGADDGGSVFDGIVNLLDRLKTERLRLLAESVTLDAQAKSRSYRKDKWFAMPVPVPKDQMTLSPTACPMLQMLSSRLHTLQTRLATPLFNIVWRQVAELLDKFIFEEVVLQNSFNPGGAAQFSFDMERNLFSLFAQYTPTPERSFKRSKGAAVLLNLSKGSALLLLEAFNDSESTQDSDAALAELGIDIFNKNSTRDILNLRTDLTLI